MPAYLKRGFFWISLLLLMGVGGGVAYALQPDKIVEVLSIGYSAPAILSKLLGTDNPPGRIGTKEIIKSVSPDTPLMLIPWEMPNFFAPLQRWWAN